GVRPTRPDYSRGYGGSDAQSAICNPMPTPDTLVVMYRELADWHEHQGQPQMRDRFLVLAADAALSSGRAAEADLLLGRPLLLPPAPVTPYSTLPRLPPSRGRRAPPDTQPSVGELPRPSPPEQAEQMFDALRAARGGQRPAQPSIPATAPIVDLDDEETPPAGR